MADYEFWGAKRSEFSLFLQRSFWKPLRSMMEIFHVLPLAAVVILFVLLATDGQFREIYISYLEGPTDGNLAWVVSIVAGLAAIALMSAVLYEAHTALSTMRINVVYSSQSDPEANSKLRNLQRAAAFALAFMPWLGLTLGLLGARNFVAARYCQLLDVAHVDPYDLQHMQYLPHIGGLPIAAGVIFLGAATAYFASVDDSNRVAQRAVSCVAPALAAVLFLLFTDWLGADPWASWSVDIFAVIAIATVVYFWIYQQLYHRRSGFVLFRAFTRTGISFRKRRRRRLILWAFLPWLIFALYFVFVQIHAPAAPVSSNCAGQIISVLGLPMPGRWAIFPSQCAPRSLLGFWSVISCFSSTPKSGVCARSAFWSLPSARQECSCQCTTTAISPFLSIGSSVRSRRSLWNCSFS